MQPHISSPVSPTPVETPPSSLNRQRDIDVDPSAQTTPADSAMHARAVATAAAAAAASASAASALPDSAPAPSDADDADLEHQSKDFLLQRVRALERQLKIRNSDCARLLSERQTLLPLREKCESQKEMILALRGQLDLARAQRESAVTEMETMKRRQRDQEHRDRVANAERAMYGNTKNALPHDEPRPSTATPSGVSSKEPKTTSAKSPQNHHHSHNTPPSQSSAPNLGRRNPGGTVVNTGAGPQLLYDSSDISSVGFTKNAKLPYDFLGGPGAQQQYLARYQGVDRGDVPDGGHDESEDGQVRRVIDAAKDQAEMEAKYAELEDKEEEALMARIKALREGRK